MNIFKKSLSHTLLSLTFFTSFAHAAPTEAEALKTVKDNLAKYFKNTAGRCFIIENINTESVPTLNSWAKKIIAFNDKAVAANYNIATGAVLSPSSEALLALEKEGRQLEYEYLGKVGNHWFKSSVLEDLNFEEIAETQSALRCTLEIKRAMALVAPPLLPKEANGDLKPEAYFELTHNGVVQKRERPNATQYAAIVVDYWFGEAGIEEIIGVGAARGENVSEYFKDIWQTGVVRALRYKKENSSYGLSWYEGNVSRAQADFDAAMVFESENGSKPFIVNEQDKPAAEFLKGAKELLQAGKDYVSAAAN